MAVKKTFAKIKNLYYPESTHQGAVGFYARDDGTFNIEANFGGRQAGMETDRASIITMRDALNELLDATEPADDPLADIVLSDAAMTEFERIVEQYPMSTNLSLQRLLRRKKPWST